MARVVTTAGELGAALRDDENCIIVEGDLVRGVLRIRFPNDTTWKIVFTVLLMAVAIIIASGGFATLAAVPMAGGAVSVLGIGATLAAIQMAVSAGDAGVLNKLREYKETDRQSTRLVLTR